MKENKNSLLIITLTILIAITGLPSAVNANAIVLQNNLATKSRTSDLAQIEYYRDAIKAQLENKANLSNIQSAKKLFLLWQASSAIYQRRYAETVDKLSVIEEEMRKQANIQIDNALLADVRTRRSDLQKDKETLVELQQEMLPLYTSVAEQLCQNLLIFETVTIITYIEKTVSDDLSTTDRLSSIKNDVAAIVKQFSHDIRSPINQLQSFTSMIPDLGAAFDGDEIASAQEIKSLVMDLSGLLKNIKLDDLIDGMNSGTLTEVEVKKDEIIAAINSVANIYAKTNAFLILARKNNDRSDFSPSARKDRDDFLIYIERSLSSLLAITRKGFEHILEETEIALPKRKPYVDFPLFFPLNNLGHYMISQPNIFKHNTPVKITSNIPKANISENDLDIIMQNIINNALKYGGETLREIAVNVDYNHSSDTIILEVSNDGAKIDADKIEYDPKTGRQRMFDPKVTGGYVDENNSRSHGIGLDTVWQLVTKAQGSVSAENTETRVKFTIKLRPYRESSDTTIPSMQVFTAA